MPAEGFPHEICNAATAYSSSAGTDIAAYDDLPCYHLLATRRLIITDDESYHGSGSELPPATSHGYAGWDFSGVPDPVMFRRFLDAADYWFGYSNTSSLENYDPTCERFTVGVDDVVDGGERDGCRRWGRPPNSGMSCAFDQERTRSSTRTSGSSLTHGTSNIYDHFTLE
jgi:hypothetical protein